MRLAAPCAEVGHRVLQRQQSLRGACAQAVYLPGVHLQTARSEGSLRKAVSELSARCEPGGYQEDAAYDQELEALASDPGQPWRAGGPVQPDTARMVDILWELQQIRTATKL